MAEEIYEENYEEDLTPLSPEEQALIEADYTEPVSDDPIEEVTYLIDSYFKIKELDPEIEYEEQMQEYALDTIRAVMAEYEIPTDDLTYLFRFVLTMERLQDKYDNDEIFGKGSSEDAKNALTVRIKEYMEEYPDMFCDPEVYDILFDIDADLQKAPTYKRVLGLCYEDILASGSVESLAAILQLYNEDKPMADEYVAKAEIPSETLEEFKQAFDLLIKNPKQKKCVTRHFAELRKIIQEKYSDDPELAAWEAAQVQKDTENKAKTYNIVKWASLAAGILFLLLFWPLGIVLLIAWGVFYFTKAHDSIPFLKAGKEAVEATSKK